MSITESTRPLYALSEGEFFTSLEQFLDEALAKSGRSTSAESQNTDPSRRFVYGLIGIEKALGVSHKTAQKLKDGILAPAVKQRGRKIVTDLELALKLFDEKNGRK